MNIDQFWELIAEIHQASRGDMDTKCSLLANRLRKLPLAEVVSFDAHFTQCLDRAYAYRLWAAAYIINGGCSDDSFSDFRSTLISMGRQTFESTLADPNFLATIDYDPDVATYEGFQYVGRKVAQQMNGGKAFKRSQPHPESPTGEDWDDETVAFLFPILAEKYNYE